MIQEHTSTAEIIIPAHASAKNTSYLGDVLLPLHTLKVAKELKAKGSVGEVTVISNIEEVIAAAIELEFKVFSESAELAAAEQIAPVVAMVAGMAEQVSDYTLVLTPNVPFRDVDRVAKFLRWSMAIQADATWTCEEVPCRAEMIVFDHQHEESVVQAIPRSERSRASRLVLTTHYAIAARTAFLIEHSKLRPPKTRLYQMPKGHITWTINNLSDLQWAEKMLET